MTVNKKISSETLGIIAAIIALCGFAAWTIMTNQYGLPRPPAGYKWQLMFEDTFDGPFLDPARWVTCYDWYDTVYKGCSNDGNNELEWYKPEQVSLQNGQLTLTAKYQPTLGWNGRYEQTYPYTSGMISTGRTTPEATPKLTVHYGYYEARIKVTGGKGIWPAFWLLPADRSWPPEIDIMEFSGDAPHNILLTYHWEGEDKKPKKDETVFKGSDFTKDWHTYAVNWQPGRIDWYIDGIMRKSVTSNKVPSKQMELIFNLAIGGNLPGNPDASTRFPATTSIDYVKAYALTK